MEVHVGVQCRAEALHERGRPGVAHRAREACLADQIAGDGPEVDAEYQRQRLRVCRQQESQRLRQRRQPPTQRLLGQKLISEHRRRLGHASRAARGAEAALPATKGDLLLGEALLATQAQEPFF